MRISISTKLIILTITLLIIVTFLFAKQSSELFETVLVQREEYSNISQAASRATEVENVLAGVIERSQIIGTLLLKNNSLSNADIDFNFNKDKNLVSIEVYKVSGRTPELLIKKVKTEVLKENKMPVDLIDRIRKIQNFPIASVAQKNIEIQNATFPKSIPLFTVGIPLIKDEYENVTHVALVDVQLAVLQKPFSEKSERVMYLIDRNGTLLAHQEEHKALAKLNFSESPLVQRSLKDQSFRRQIQFNDHETEKPFIGAYIKNPSFGVTVVAQTDKEIILEPSKDVQRKAIYIAGIVISSALFFIFLFSMSLTGPIERLAELIQLVSKGQFDIHARAQVTSNDEVGDLAVAFDNMTEGLKERDKVKNLFSKFHGSSVAEDLLQKDIGVGGQNKEVTVFFSDIRGFTSFSEKRTPEEVVDMLNSYFEVMVGIINKHGGVVDKFIGDAIMAVWGAPQESPDDTQKAVKACLEMRKSLLDLNQKRESKGEPPIMIGMGLHCGRAISGTIGSSERMEYTVIGDTVNMTSRIEASTKAFGADLLVSETVVQKVEDHFKFTVAGSAEVKGKSEPLKLYKCHSYKDESTGEWVEVKTPYSDYEAEKADKVKIAS